METEHGIKCECGQTFQNQEELKKHVHLQDLAIHREYDPRQPNRQELEKIVEWYINNHGLDYEQAVGTVNQAYHIVIDGYTTGSPGYAGKVLIEIGSPGPSFYTVYTPNNGKLQRRQQAVELRDNPGE